MKNSSSITKSAFITYVLIILVWILAWTFKSNVIDRHVLWLAGNAGTFLYWTTAKVLIWILPALWLIKNSGRSVSEVFNFSNWRKFLVWGIGFGLLVALPNFIQSFLKHHSLFSVEPSFAHLNAFLIAPVFEEFLLRGAILGSLHKELVFWQANLFSAIMFLGLHIPGWYFEHNLAQKFSSLTGGGLYVLLLGVILGFVFSRSKSLVGSIIVHFMNNFSSM